MAEGILSGLTANVLKTLGSHALSPINSALGVHDELQKLKDTMSVIQAVVLDAEKQQTSNRRLGVLLGMLKDALYDADDVLDEFQIEAWRRETESRTRKVRRFAFGFNFKMARKIKKVRERFDEIAKNINQFDLAKGLEEKGAFFWRETHSFVNVSDVTGRDGDKNRIINLLIEEINGEQLSIIPIVGLGGLGKTTLAKLAYNDNKIVEQFDLRMWACISEEFEFDLGKVIKKILKSVDERTDFNSLELDQLQRHLRHILHDKKYFLVLDDVWNDDRSKWIELESLLMCGAPGSKILVTTRSDLVASMLATRTTSIHTLEELPDEHCLSLFLKFAFETREDTEKHPELVEIGREIVAKCKGVPLAVKTLGKLLYMKLDRHEWENVRDNEIWKLEQKEGDILPVLKLSYDHLPPHLKRCFAYCSIFPKDFEFWSDFVISMWSAQGLLGSLEENEGWEDIGKMYIKQLLSSGLFQDFEDFGSDLQFKMHDLVHDLALQVGKPEHFIIDSQNIQCNDTKRVRHLSFYNYNCLAGDEVPSWLLEMRHLHTICFPFDGAIPNGQSFLKTCFSRFNYLRTLSLTTHDIEVLPSSVARLKHLRYLDLSGNIKLKSLPNSICELVGLETLALGDCEGLERLPKGLGKLIRLRILVLATKVKCLPDKEIRCLTSLRILIISCCPNIRCLLSNEGMQSLSALRTLYIDDCRSLVQLPVSGLRSLIMLENLVIRNCEMLDLNNAKDEEEEEKGLNSLRFLRIRKMPKLVALPSWILPGSLQYIHISGCENLKELMPEGLLQNLKSLYKIEIEDCPQLISLPENMGCLASLEELRIENCPELIERCKRGTGEDWPKIAHVSNIYLNGLKI